MAIDQAKYHAVQSPLKVQGGLMQQVHRWQLQYIGATTLPKTLSTVELSAFFTYSEAERAEIAKKRKDALRIAAAVQLGFLKMTGSTLDYLNAIPLRLLRHVATEICVPPVAIASLRSIYDRPKTRFDHQWWAMELLGFRKADKEAGLTPIPRTGIGLILKRMMTQAQGCPRRRASPATNATPRWATRVGCERLVRCISFQSSWATGSRWTSGVGAGCTNPRSR